MKPKGGLEEPQGGTPPLKHEKITMSKIDFKAIWSIKNKKMKSGK